MKKLILALLFLISFNLNATDIEKLVRSGNLQAIKTLKASELSHGLRSRSGQNALALALNANQKQISAWLASRGLGLNVRDYLGKTPLMFAAMKSGNVKVIKTMLELGSSPFIKDKLGRDLNYYANRSGDHAIKALIAAQLQNTSTISSAELNTLRAFLKNVEVKKVGEFFRKHRRMDMKIDGLSVVGFLHKEKLLAKWGLSTFIEMGVDLNDGELIHQVIEAKDSVLTEVLLSYFVRLSPRQKDGKTPLMLALEKKLPSELILKIFKQTVSFNKVDKNGDNHLHHAIRAGNKELISLLKKKQVSLNQANKKGITPAMLAVGPTGKDEILDEVLGPEVDFSSRDENGNDVAMQLAANHPRAYYRHSRSIRNSGYQENSRNNNGQTAVQVLQERHPNVVSSMSRRDVNTDVLPDMADLGNEDMSDEHDTWSSEDVPRFQEREAPYSGDAMLDELFKNSLLDFLLAAKGKYLKKLKDAGLASQNDGKITRQIIELNKELKDVDEKILDLNAAIMKAVADYNAKKEEYENRVQVFNRQNQEYESSFTGLKGFMATLTNKAREIEESLKYFTEIKLRIADVKRRLKNGEHEDAALLNEIKRAKSLAEVTYKNTLLGLEAEFEGQIQSERSEVIALEEELAEHNSQVSSESSISNRYINEVNQHTIYIENQKQILESPAHQLVHDKDTCPYLKNIDRTKPKLKNAEQKLQRSQNALRSFRNRANATNAALNKARSQFSTRRANLLNEKKEQLKLLKREHNSEQEKLESRIKAARFSVDTAWAEARDELEAAQEELKTKYGSVGQVESAWKKVGTLINGLNQGVKNFENIFICPGFVGVIVGCELRSNFDISDTVLGAALRDGLDNVAGQYATHLNKRNDLSATRQSMTDFTDLEANIAHLKKSRREKRDKRPELLSQIEELKDRQQRTDLNKISTLVEKEEQLILNAVLPVSLHPEYEQALSQEIQKLRVELGVTNLSLQALLSKQASNPTPSSESFNTLDENEIKVVTTLEKVAKTQALGTWFDLILTHEQMSGPLFQQKHRGLFAHALAATLEVKRVTDGQQNSLQLTTPFGNFLLNEEGGIFEHRARDFFDIELISSGPVRTQIESLLSHMRAQIPVDYDRSKLAESYELSIVMDLIRQVDRLHYSKKAKKILDYTEVIVKTGLAFSGAGVGVIALTGLPKCGLQLYQFFGQDISMTKIEIVQMFADCVGTFHQLEKFIPDLKPVTGKLLLKLEEFLQADGSNELKQSILQLFDTFMGLNESKFQVFIGKLKFNNFHLKASDFYKKVKFQYEGRVDYVLKFSASEEFKKSMDTREYVLTEDVQVFEHRVGNAVFHSYLDLGFYPNQYELMAKKFNYRLAAGISYKVKVVTLKKGTEVSVSEDIKDLIIVERAE